MSSTTIHNTNKACCTIPPVISDYTPKGKFQAVGAFQKVYVTGEENAKFSLVAVFDIFGYVFLLFLLVRKAIQNVISCRFFPQTQQGADILASTLKTRVYMPDFFEPHPAFPKEKYPPVTAEDKAAIHTFFAGTGNWDIAVTKLEAFGHVLKHQGIQKLGAYGFCWGAWL
jgi:hypothetical protein